MAIEVQKKDGESAAALVRRFSKRVQQSGILLRARQLRFHKKDPNKRAVRKMALRRGERKKEYERLQKLGLLNKKS